MAGKKKTGKKKVEEEVLEDEDEETEEEEEETEDAEEADEDESEEEESEEADEAEEEERPQKNSGKGEVIFVNKEKLSRAKNILLLVSGKQAPRKTEELERKEHYAGLLADRGVKASDTKALRVVYEELLGGLVRTHVEQKEAEQKAAALKSKLKKRKVSE